MALIKCPECNKEISDTAKTCIHCGYKINSDTNYRASELLKLGIPMILIFLLKKPVLYFFYYTAKFLGLNTGSKLVGSYLYSIFHVGIIVFIIYMIYKKILKISNKNHIIIALIIVVFITSMTVFIIPNKGDANYTNQNNEENNTNEKEDLVSCANTGYFIQQLQGELYSSYSGYGEVIITKCDSFVYSERIWAHCDFKYRVTTNMSFQTGSFSRTYSCK